MNSKITNFTYVSTQTLQNAFPDEVEQRPLQLTSQPVSVTKKTVSAELKTAAHKKQGDRT